MKCPLIFAFVALALLATGFVSGRFFQHAQSGYHYEVRDTKEYASPVGLVRWSYVTEYVGISFLDPGTTILEIDGRTIYKAKRAFQETTPFARNVNVSQNKISWDDGEFSFDLTLHRMKTGEQNTASGGGTPPN